MKPSSSWKQIILEDINAIVETGNPLVRKPNGFKVCVGYFWCNVCCSPCIIWSTVCRILACPFQCIIKGPGFICSDNNCTICSDVCVSACVKDIHKEKKALPDDITKATSEEIQEIFQAAAQAFTRVQVNQRNYMIYDYLLPYVKSYLKTKNDSPKITSPTDMIAYFESFASDASE